MRLRRTVQKAIREVFYSGVHPSGLEVLISPKRGFARKLAVLGTRFGSIDTRVGTRNGEVALPDGLAHFLEHQLFTKKEGDVFERFARTGASANAGTGFSQTSYYFSCTRDFRRNLSLLLDLVFTPYFSEENVRKEQGIIAQEILMYRDNPDWRIFMNLLGALYARHPVRTDIAGSVESIARITPTLLADAYGTFYHPSNMVLVVTGDVDHASVAGQVEGFLDRRGFEPAPRIGRLPPPEPRRVHRRRTLQRMVLSQPRLLVGFKDPAPPPEGRDLLRREIEVQLLLQLLFGRGSDLYESLYREGLIDDSFGASYSAEGGFGFSAVGGDTDHPQRLEEALRRGIRRARRRGLRRQDFLRARRKLLGKFFFGVNLPESSAMTLLSFWMKRCPVGDYPGMLGRVRLRDLESRLAEHFTAGQSAVSVLRPSARGPKGC